MRPFRGFWAGIVCSCAVLAFSVTAVLADSITWHVTSEYPYIVYVTFAADGENRAWPGGDQLYEIKDSQEHVYRLQCDYAGQKICFGASDSNNVDTYEHYWGVGVANRESCTNCCHVCNGDTDAYEKLSP